MLTPFARHVAVGGNGWWCDGPVSLWLAAIHHHLGQPELARQYLPQAEAAVRALRDARVLRRVEALRSHLANPDASPTELEPLTGRERLVLARLATGATNAEIARQLSFSVSTIRNDTSALYRKLAVTGRPEAVARAIALGLLTTPSEP